MTDLNPPPRIWECDWLLIDLERIKGITRYRPHSDAKKYDGKISVFLVDEEDSFVTFEDYQEAYANGEDLIRAWKEYRSYRKPERL